MTGWMRHLGASAITLAWAVAALLATAGAADPDDADASAEFDRLYGQALTEVGTSAARDDDLDLAAEMLRTATQRTDTPALAQMLCWSAYELTDDVEDGFDTAAGAMELVARRFPIGRAKALDRLAGLYQRRLAHRDRLERAIAAEVLVQVHLDLARAHLVAGEPSQAASSIQRALSQARSARSPALQQAGALNALVARRVSLAKRLDVLDQAIRTNPADLAARTAAIRLCLAELDDPNRARGYVNAQVDEAVRPYVPLACKEIMRVEPEAVIELARWYRALAADESGPARATCMRRALACAERYLVFPARPEENIRLAADSRDDARRVLAQAGEVPRLPLPKPPVRLRLLALGRILRRAPGEAGLEMLTRRMVGAFELKKFSPEPIADARSGRWTGLALRRCQGMTHLDHLSGLGLRSLRIAGAPELRNVNALAWLPLEELELLGCPKVDGLAPLKGLALRTLVLDGVAGLTGDLSALAGMELESLAVHHARGLTSLDGLTGTKLRSVSIQHCPRLAGDLTPLADTGVRSLHLASTGALSTDGLGELGELTDLTLGPAVTFEDVSQLEGLRPTRLRLEGVSIGEDLSALRDMPLEALELVGVKGLKRLTPLDGMDGLVSLRIWNCPDLTDGPEVLKDLDLRELRVHNWPALKDFTFAASMPLTTLGVYSCPELSGDLLPLRGKKLRELTLAYCPKLKTLVGIEHLPLAYLNVTGSDKLPDDELQRALRVPTLREIHTSNRQRDQVLNKRLQRRGR